MYRLIGRRVIRSLIVQWAQIHTKWRIAIIRSLVVTQLFRQLAYCIEAGGELYHFYLYVGKNILFLYCLVLNSLSNSFDWNVLDLFLLDDVWNVLDIVLDHLIIGHLPCHGNLDLSSDFLVFHVGFLVRDVLNS